MPAVFLKVSAAQNPLTLKVIQIVFMPKLAN
jgi:hypothetical protein